MSAVISCCFANPFVQAWFTDRNFHKALLMFLKSLHLENIRCFREASLNFDGSDTSVSDNRKWTVLLGENGTGKSTVLRSAGLVLSGSNALPELVGQPSDWIRAGCKSGRIVAELETAKGRNRKIELVLERNDDITALLARSQKSMKLLNDALEHTARNYLTIGYGAMRRFGRASLSLGDGSQFQHPRSRSMASLFDNDALLQPLEAWAMQLDYQSEGGGLEVIKSTLADFLPDMQFSHIDKQRQTLVFETKDGLVPLQQLSDSDKTIAAWVGDLLFQVTRIFDDFKDPLSARSLLIVDEVDLFLHPKWQRKLLAFLDSRLPNMQLLVTTNSVVTAQQSPENSLHYCARRDEAAVIERFERNPRTMLLHQLIATEAFGQMSDESLDVETAKSEFRILHSKKKKTKKDRLRMDQLSEQLNQRPQDEHSEMILTEQQRDLIKQIIDSESGET